jgi:hypothetical protein
MFGKATGFRAATAGIERIAAAGCPPSRASICKCSIADPGGRSARDRFHQGRRYHGAPRTLPLGRGSIASTLALQRRNLFA